MLLIENHPAPHHESWLSILQLSSLLETRRICATHSYYLRPGNLLYYYLHARILRILSSETIVEIGTMDMAESGLFSRLSHVSAREAVVRSYVAISWIWESLVFLDGANAILSLVAVISGLDALADWPSMFGSIDDIRGLRGFWAKFWHRLALRPYGNAGRAVVSGLGSILGLGRNDRTFLGAQMQGAIIAFLIFLLSGLSHAAVSCGLACVIGLTFNFIACVIEIYFLSALKYLAHKAGLTKELRAMEKSWLSVGVRLLLLECSHLEVPENEPAAGRNGKMEAYMVKNESVRRGRSLYLIAWDTIRYSVIHCS